MGSLPTPRLSVNDYLAADRASDHPFEYHDGEMLEIESATIAHGTVMVNVARWLAELLDNGPCRVATQVRVRISASKYVYPDLFVYCGEAASPEEQNDTITNPKVIVEVLSPSTEGYDRGVKFDLYRELPSFEEYVLVSQDKHRIETLRRTPEGDWLLKRFEGADAIVNLPSLGVALRLGSVYAGVL